VKYANAPIRFSTSWHHPDRLELGRLPGAGAGGGVGVYWTTGICLFRHGDDRRRAARYANELTHDQRVWQASLGLRAAAGQLLPYASVWDQLRATRPDWLARWAIPVLDQLAHARPIRPHRLGASQLEVARPHWERYLQGEEREPRRALAGAMSAVEKRLNR